MKENIKTFVFALIFSFSCLNLFAMEKDVSELNMEKNGEDDLVGCVSSPIAIPSPKVFEEQTYLFWSDLLNYLFYDYENHTKEVELRVFIKNFIISCSLVEEISNLFKKFLEEDLYDLVESGFRKEVKLFFNIIKEMPLTLVKSEHDLADVDGYLSKFDLENILIKASFIRVLSSFLSKIISRQRMIDDNIRGAFEALENPDSVLMPTEEREEDECGEDDSELPPANSCIFDMDMN